MREDRPQDDLLRQISPKRSDSRRLARDHLPHQARDEDREKDRGGQRQRRDIVDIVENAPIREIDMIFRGLI